MSDTAGLWKRIEDARKRLGMDEAAQIKQVGDLNDRIKEVRRDLAGRYRELEGHREEVSKLRHENEQLRRMLHRLLLAIEQRRGARLKTLMSDLSGEMTALAEPEGTREAEPRWLRGVTERAGAPDTQPDPEPESDLVSDLGPKRSAVA